MAAPPIVSGDVAKLISYDLQYAAKSPDMRRTRRAYAGRSVGFRAQPIELRACKEWGQSSSGSEGSEPTSPVMPYTNMQAYVKQAHVEVKEVPVRTVWGQLRSWIGPLPEERAYMR
eukprot:GFYU01010185.1.p1 GENE.GFYU01010185.1~~GFYU01010185.1.p1  ORF type:complete len:116 (-),score=22.49 GFYU01010185.1:697-1044(-)